uniref:Sleeping Beauty transposase HTH domain-containing protein n=1 Tax=Oncorhynchus tshawytscha TaxID=74940 RepID=A0AAZ3R1R5_ONCTS
MSEQKQGHEELSIVLRYMTVSRHRSGEGYQNISAALKVPKNTVASIILKWKKFGTIKTLPRAGRPAKLSNRGRRGLGQGGPVRTPERRRLRAMRPPKHDPAKPHCFLKHFSLNPEASRTNESEETLSDWQPCQRACALPATGVARARWDKDNPDGQTLP